MRAVDACGLLVAAYLGTGCGAAAPPPTAPTASLQRAPAMGEARERLVRPRGECLERALAHVHSPSELMSDPLPPAMQERMELLLDGLHPRAKQVLARTHGIWLAQNIPDAAAVFLPCEVDASSGRGGFVLIDAGQFPLDSEVRDVDVPVLYWRGLAGELASTGPLARAPTYSARGLDPAAPAFADHAVRYLILHELGHAFSLLTSEFGLDGRGRMQVDDMNGFVGYSWRMMTTERKYLPLSGGSATVQAVVPKRSLDTFQWGALLATLDADAALLAPGWAVTPKNQRAARSRVVCSVVSRIPEAGFVTPTAARYPTEDFAEMFAHAILADEGKIVPDDRIPIELPACRTHELASPYFSPALVEKRFYLERALGLEHAPLVPSRPAAQAKTTPKAAPRR